MKTTRRLAAAFDRRVPVDIPALTEQPKPDHMTLWVRDVLDTLRTGLPAWRVIRQSQGKKIPADGRQAG